MKHAKSRYFQLVLGAFVIFSISSCAHSKTIVYFHDLADTANNRLLDSVGNHEATIQVGDVLDIYIASRNPQASAAFNLGDATPVSSTSQDQGGQPAPATTGSSTPRGYKVERDGAIDFPVLGKLAVEGYTVNRLRDTLKSRLEEYLKTPPFVYVRFLNYRITVLGEVARPSSYALSGERTSVIDALGMAGDLTIYGKRNTVLVIREENGKRTYSRLDLTSSKIFESPYFYLKQNDILYVEPNRTRELASNDRLLRIITIGGSLLSILVSSLLLFKL